MKTNIFWEHYKKRDGAIYKDLAFLSHKQRIELLYDFMIHSMDMTAKIGNDKKLYKQYKSLIKANKRSIRFYCNLRDYCNKNKHIQKIT